MWHVWWSGEVHARVWWGNMRETNHFSIVDWGIILKWIFKNWNGGARTEFIWLRMGTGGGFF